MVNLTLNANQIIIAVAILVYIVVISIAINKYHKYLDRINKIQTRFKYKYIDEVVLKETITLNQEAIKNSKIRFYVFIVIIGFCHFTACLIIDSSPLSAGIPFLLFTLLLIGNYWLKGSSVSSSIKNLPGISDYHGP